MWLLCSLLFGWCGVSFGVGCVVVALPLLLVVVVVPLMVLRFGVALLVGGAVLAHTATLFLRLFLRRYLLLPWLRDSFAVHTHTANKTKGAQFLIVLKVGSKLLRKVSKSQMLY